jgi:hypothetical protein
MPVFLTDDAAGKYPHPALKELVAAARVLFRSDPVKIVAAQENDASSTRTRRVRIVMNVRN